MAPGVDAVEESPAAAQRTKKTLPLHVSLMQVTRESPHKGGARCSISFTFNLSPALTNHAYMAC